MFANNRSLDGHKGAACALLQLKDSFLNIIRILVHRTGFLGCFCRLDVSHGGLRLGHTNTVLSGSAASQIEQQL